MIPDSAPLLCRGADLLRPIPASRDSSARTQTKNSPLREEWAQQVCAPTRHAGWLLPVLVALLATTSLSAGTIVGTVKAQGAQADSGGGGGGGAYASRRYKFVERLDYEQLRDFVVHVDQAFPGVTFSPPKDPAVIRQKDAVFVPHVLPILAGTTVEWPNLDDIYHNVFCMAETKPFDLGLYNSETAAKRVVFDKPGQADVFCSIHTKMHCVVLVLTNPYFATTDDKGRFTIPDVPAGTYTLRAWHERMPGQTVTVTVPAEGEVRIDITLGLATLPKY
jgi:plastocyanin